MLMVLLFGLIVVGFVVSLVRRNSDWSFGLGLFGAVYFIILIGILAAGGNSEIITRYRAYQKYSSPKYSQNACYQVTAETTYDKFVSRLDSRKLALASPWSNWLVPNLPEEVRNFEVKY